MRSYKRKEYILILILLYTSVTLCNPCVNQTLNAIPYPNDCQAFILCWLSHAYLQTCPNGLFFDIKTNNCQPLFTTTCCNVTLPILIIPLPIYQGSTVPTNKTNVRTATITKQINSSGITPLLPILNTNSTLITSSNQPEVTTSIISILSTESSDPSQSSDSSQSSEFTLHVTEQTEMTTRSEPSNIDIDVTKSTKSVNPSQPNVYKTSTITSYTEFHTKKTNSTVIVSTDISEATTPIESTLWTDSRLTPSSGFTLNTTEKEITTPQTSTFVSKLTKSEETKKTESQTKVSTTSAFLTSIDSSNKTPNSTLITSTNPSQPTTPIVFTLWSEPTDSSETSSSGYIWNVELSTTPLETTSTYVRKKQSTQPNVHSTPPIVSSTEYSNYTHLTSTSNSNLPSVATFNSPLNPLNTEGPHTSAISTIRADTIISTKTFPIITSESFGTEPQTFTESSTWQPSFSSTVNIPSSLNSSFFPTKYSTTELDGAPKTTRYYRNKTSATSLFSLSENTQASITMVMPTFSTDFTENYEYITRENLSTPVPSDKSYSLPELKTDNINFLTSSKKLSTDTYSTITATVATESRIFTESSTLQPLVSTTANILSSTKMPYFPTIISTKKRGQPSTTTQYSVEDTSTKSSPYLTEAITQESDTTTMTTEYIPTTITSSASQLEIFNKTKLLTTTEHSLTAVTSQSLPLQFISSTSAPKSETTVVLSTLSESTEATKHITTGTETTFVTFLTTVHSSSPATDKLASSPSNLKSTTDYTTIIPVTTVSSSYNSELNINNNSHFTSTFQPKLTKTTKYDVESPSTTLKSFPISTEEKHRSAVTTEPSISTMEPTTSTENNLHTDSVTHTIQSTISEEFKSTHSTLFPSITIFTSKSITSSPETTTVKPIVTQIVRTLPPLPYSPPPCVFATTTQKARISEKTLPNIPPIVTSTYIAPEISTNSPFSKPACGFFDKFVFPDESDCKHYYECLFGGIRKVSCRYGYEFNPYALKCMPHLEANCQRRKSSKEVLDFLYYIMKLNDLSASGPLEY